MKHGLLIAVDAVDKAGKETQVDELAKRLILDGEEVVTIDFPSYDSTTGEIIEEILEGTHDLTIQEHPYEVQALFVINRYEQQQRIEHALLQGKIVICDRYTYSSVVFGALNGVDREWLDSIQHSLVQPDINILLDITPEEYKKRCLAYDSLDVYERNHDFIFKAMEMYRQIAKEEEWLIINGVGEVDTIADNLYKEVKSLIKAMEVDA